jgi:hypothetical protein
MIVGAETGDAMESARLPIAGAAIGRVSVGSSINPALVQIGLAARQFTSLGVHSRGVKRAFSLCWFYRCLRQQLLHASRPADELPSLPRSWAPLLIFYRSRPANSQVHVSDSHFS